MAPVSAPVCKAFYYASHLCICLLNGFGEGKEGRVICVLEEMYVRVNVRDTPFFL